MKVQWWIIKVILLENDRLLLENLSLDDRWIPPKSPRNHKSGTQVLLAPLFGPEIKIGENEGPMVDNYSDITGK